MPCSLVHVFIKLLCNCLEKQTRKIRKKIQINNIFLKNHDWKQRKTDGYYLERVQLDV